MKPKTASLALAAGLFLLALWSVFHPPAKAPQGPVGDQKTDGTRNNLAVGTPTPMPVGIASPGVSSGDTKVAGGQQTPAGSGTMRGASTSATSSDAEEADRAAANKTDSAPRNPEIDVVKVRVMMHDYHNLMGENPVGTNAEIMKALMGGNAKTATLGPPEGMTLNSAGELVDQWNTPYFFHQLSKDVMEIRSAGPDKVMWTADDIVTR